MAPNNKKGIVHEAVQDARQLKDLAVDAAMARIIERVSPSVRALVERDIRTGKKNEDLDRLRRADDGHGETEFEESADKGEKQMDTKELDLEALVGMFPGLSEIEDEEGLEDIAASGEPDGDECSPAGKKSAPVKDEAFGGIPQLGEAEEEEGEDMAEGKDKEEDMDEEVEISESDLQGVYEAALKAQRVAEVMVKKGFSDMTPSGELNDVDPAAGVAEFKKGEAMWDDKGSLPPTRKDWTVKEVKQMIARGMNENKALREQNKKLLEAFKTVVAKLTETNLFNSKVLHVNKLFQTGKLTKEQRKSVVESIDTGKTVDEVKKISLTLERTFKSLGVVQESRKPRASNSGARTTGGLSQGILRESTDKGVSSNNSRWMELAGIVNK